jgi:hypothetical protein
MAAFLINVLQNTLLTSILYSALFAFSSVINGKRQTKPTLLSGAGAVVISVIVAVLKETTRFVKKDNYNIIILISGIALYAAFIVFAWLYRGEEKDKNEKIKLTRTVLSAAAGAFLLMYSLPIALVYPADFAPMGESVLSTDYLLKSAGFLSGILVSAITGIILYKVALKIPYKYTRIVLFGFVRDRIRRPLQDGHTGDVRPEDHRNQKGEMAFQADHAPRKQLRRFHIFDHRRRRRDPYPVLDTERSEKRKDGLSQPRGRAENQSRKIEGTAAVGRALRLYGVFGRLSHGDKNL